MPISHHSISLLINARPGPEHLHFSLFLCFHMSSSPSTQTPEQSSGADQNLERTDIRNPHRSRNRNHRSNINHSDSGRDEPGIDGGQRRTTDRRHRHKPKGSIVDEPHASPSTPVTSQRAATSHNPQSDPAASAGPAPSAKNLNRPPHPAKGRASHVQDANSPASGSPGHTRRAARSNPGSKTGASVPTNDANPPRKRNKAPAGDDLTSILTFSLSTPPFPECMICFNRIRPDQPTWSCSPREEKEAQSCWNTFHLKCIHSWAEKSVKDVEEAWRARGEERKGEWRCPGCQSKREIVPRKYW